jgi:hypothetical protein
MRRKQVGRHALIGMYCALAAGLYMVALGTWGVSHGAWWCLTIVGSGLATIFTVLSLFEYEPSDGPPPKNPGNRLLDIVERVLCRRRPDKDDEK